MENRLGQRFGNYQLTRLLARGGYAEVYLAQHIYLQSQAAIKLLQAQFSDDEMRDFLEEARTLVKLTHPNIVRVLEFGVEDNTLFLVMDYAPNGSLRQCYPRGVQLPLSLVTTYVRQAASALHYAHGQKLIHRDIKPENMLLGRNKELLLSDFGVAVLAQSALSGGNRQIAGTIAYMAPEQVQGKPCLASDQYALAIVAYEWLCGERPFHGTLSEVASQQICTPPPSLHEKVPNLPLAVEEVIMTALAKDPTQRYSSILEFADALERAGQSISQANQESAVGSILVLSQVPAAESNDAVTAVLLPSTGSQEEASENALVIQKGKKLFAAQSITKEWAFAVALGVLLYTLSSNFLLVLVTPSQGLLWIQPALVLLIAFGAIYGFWAGLIIGELGYFLGSYISVLSHTSTHSSIVASTLTGLSLPWYFHLGFLTIGAITGLAASVTKGQYRSVKNIALAEFFGIIGLLSGFLLVFNSFWPHLYKGESLWIDFTHIAVPNLLLIVVLLPLLLMIQSLFNRSG